MTNADVTKSRPVAWRTASDVTLNPERANNWIAMGATVYPLVDAAELAAMTARAEAAEARAADLTAKLDAAMEALKPFADIGIGSDPDYQPTIRMDRAAIVAARNAVEMAGASTSAKINWRNDPIAFVEDDEPMNWRDYE